MSDPRTLAHLLSPPPENTHGLVVAYSGGRDSTALLHALAHTERSPSLRAVHVWHGLEAAADDWAAHCQRQCAGWGVACARFDVVVDRRQGGLEAAARVARYDALAASLAPGEVLVTAHHAEDQAETFLLQALRGAGVAGLAGMPRLAPFGAGRLWRPWLDVARREITAYVAAQDLDWVEDRSNHDPQRARGHLRTRVWPAIVAHWPGAAKTLARSAGWAAQANEAIATLAGLDLEAARGQDNTLCIDVLRGLSAARRAEVLRRWLAGGGRDRPDHRHVGEIGRLLDAREHGGPRVVFAETEVRRFDGRLFAMARLAPPPAAAEIAWRAPGEVWLPPGCGRLAISSPPAAWPTDMRLGFGRAGERLRRADGRAESVSEYLRRRRVPPWVRERLPRVHVGDELIALPGLWSHPSIGRWFGGDRPEFDWRHELAGAPCSAGVQPRDDPTGR